MPQSPRFKALGDGFENLPYFSPASALGDSMDQLSQRSSSERTQFMSREDLDQEGSLDLDHDHYHYHDEDQDQYVDHELEQHAGLDQKPTRGASVSTPTKTLELKVRDERTERSFYCRTDVLRM